MLHNFAALTYTTTTTTSSHSTGLFLTTGLIGLVVFVISIAALWKVFEKAGKPGWAALIPVYDAWVLFEISGKPGWWALSMLLMVIPIVGWIPYFVLHIIAMLELAKRFNKDTVFAVVGLILFSLVGLLILGFGKDQYNAGGSASPGPKPPDTQPPATPSPSSQLPPVQPPQA